MPDIDTTTKLLFDNLRDDIKEVSRNVKDDIGKISDSITDLSKTVTGISTEITAIKITTDKQDKHLDNLFKGHRNLKERVGLLENKKPSTPPAKANGNGGPWGKLLGFAIKSLPQLIVGLLLGAAGVGYLLALIGK